MKRREDRSLVIYLISSLTAEIVMTCTDVLECRVARVVLHLALSDGYQYRTESVPSVDGNFQLALLPPGRQDMQARGQAFILMHCRIMLEPQCTSSDKTWT
jgi:hypothetical protein